MPHRKPELDRIITDLEAFIQKSCEFDPKNPTKSGDPVGEKCNDAVLMLFEARNLLGGTSDQKKQ